VAREEAALSGAVAARPREAPVVEAADEQVTLATRRGQVLLAGMTAAHFSHHVSNSLLNPMLPFIRDSFALSYSESGFLVTAFSLSLGMSNAPIGALADRVGPRPVIVVGLLLTGLVSAALAYAGAYWQLLLLLIAMGLIAGSYHAPAAALLTRAFPASSRGAAMGLHVTGGHLSFFITPMVAAALVSLTGTWRTPYLWLAFAPLVTGAAVWYLAPKRHERPLGTSPLAAFREVWGFLRLVGPIIGASILFQMVYAALLAFVTLYLVDARGVPAPIAAVLFGVPQVAGVLGAPLGGTASDRLGRRAVILIGLGAIGPAFYALTLVPNALLLLPLLAIGLAGTLRQTITEVLVMDTAPPARRATILGGYYLLAQPLGGLAAPLLGSLAGGVGIDAAFTSVTLGFAICSLLVALILRRWL